MSFALMATAVALKTLGGFSKKSKQNKALRKKEEYQAAVQGYNAMLQVDTLQDAAQDSVSTKLQNEQIIQLNNMRAAASNRVTATSTGASGASQDRIVTSFDASAAMASKANEDKLTSELNAIRNKQGELLTNAAFAIENAGKDVPKSGLGDFLLDLGGNALGAIL